MSDEQQLAAQGRAYKELRDRKSRCATITAELRSLSYRLSETASLIAEFINQPTKRNAAGVSLSSHLNEKLQGINLEEEAASLVAELLKETEAIRDLEADISKF